MTPSSQPSWFHMSSLWSLQRMFSLRDFGRVALDDALVTAKLVSHVLFVVIAEDVLTKGLVRETCLNMFCIYLLTHVLALLCSCLQTLTLFGRLRSRTCHNSEGVDQLARNQALCAGFMLSNLSLYIGVPSGSAIYRPVAFG
mmetsp:Transcript_17697/g.40621  ORF Transcript_17697/g.40621 Transcript_17697/m.40621 type:complete len:142 (-) Transcript_17697:52-477(-)